MDDMIDVYNKDTPWAKGRLNFCPYETLKITNRQINNLELSNLKFDRSNHTNMTSYNLLINSEYRGIYDSTIHLMLINNVKEKNIDCVTAGWNNVRAAMRQKAMEKEMLLLYRDPPSEDRDRRYRSLRSEFNTTEAEIKAKRIIFQENELKKDRMMLEYKSLYENQIILIQTKLDTCQSEKSNLQCKLDELESNKQKGLDQIVILQGKVNKQLQHNTELIISNEKLQQILKESQTNNKVYVDRFKTMMKDKSKEIIGLETSKAETEMELMMEKAKTETLTEDLKQKLETESVLKITIENLEAQIKSIISQNSILHSNIQSMKTELIHLHETKSEYEAIMSFDKSKILDLENAKIKLMVEKHDLENEQTIPKQSKEELKELSQQQIQITTISNTCNGNNELQNKINNYEKELSEMHKSLPTEVEPPHITSIEQAEYGVFHDNLTIGGDSIINPSQTQCQNNSIEEYFMEDENTEILLVTAERKSIKNPPTKSKIETKDKPKFKYVNHKRAENVKCTLCEKKFSTKKIMRAHAKIKHSFSKAEPINKCPKCSKNFINKYTLKIHTDSSRKCGSQHNQ